MDLKACPPLAILGHPVGHSLSPLIHNTALVELGFQPGYVACDVAPEQLGSAVEGLRALGFRGANVTIPYKTAVLPLMHSLSESASAIGAVNTIIVRDDGLRGDNTDHIGFIQPLQPLRDRLRGQHAVVLGAGGAARGVLYALQSHLELDSVTLISRRPEQADALAAESSRLVQNPGPGPRVGTAPWSSADSACRAAQLLVNTTPMGMSGKAPDSPVSPSAFGGHQVAYDLVYTPSITTFLTLASAAGALGIGGLPMLLGQAAASFLLWTGLEMPMSPVEKAVNAFLT